MYSIGTVFCGTFSELLSIYSIRLMFVRRTEGACHSAAVWLNDLIFRGMNVINMMTETKIKNIHRLNQEMWQKVN